MLVLLGLNDQVTTILFSLIQIASRWVWDVARDTWVQAQHETENYVAVALIVACYYE